MTLRNKCAKLMRELCGDGGQLFITKDLVYAISRKTAGFKGQDGEVWEHLTRVGTVASAAPPESVIDNWYNKYPRSVDMEWWEIPAVAVVSIAIAESCLLLLKAACYC